MSTYNDKGGVNPGDAARKLCYIYDNDTYPGRRIGFEKQTMITLDKSLEPLQQAFNNSPGTIKFLAILSPT